MYPSQLESLGGLSRTCEKISEDDSEDVTSWYPAGTLLDGAEPIATPKTTKAPFQRGFLAERATEIEPATSSLGSCVAFSGGDVHFVHVSRADAVSMGLPTSTHSYPSEPERFRLR